MNVTQEIFDYIRNVLEIDTSGHDSNSRLMQDMGVDSLDFAQLMLHLEDVTGVTVSEDSISWEHVQTVWQLAGLFEGKS